MNVLISRGHCLIGNGAARGSPRTPGTSTYCHLLTVTTPGYLRTAEAYMANMVDSVEGQVATRAVGHR